MNTKQSDVYKGLGINNMVNKVVEVLLIYFLTHLRAIMPLFLLMDRQVQEKLSLWRVTIM